MLFFNIWIFAGCIKFSITYDKERDLAGAYTIVHFILMLLFGAPFLSLIIPAIATFFVSWGFFRMLRILSGLLWWVAVIVFMGLFFLL